MRDSSGDGVRFDSKELKERLFGVLAANSDLRLEERKLKKWDGDFEESEFGLNGDVHGEGRKVFVKAWKQGDAEKTRKFVAPLLKAILEGETQN